MGETGDLVDARLRNGRVHTADGGLEFITEVLERAERHLCKKPLVRFDAGYPGEALMSALEARGTHFVARIRNNAVLKRLAVSGDRRAGVRGPGPPGGQRPVRHLELRAGRGVPRRLLVARPARRPDPGGAPGRALPPLLLADHVASGRRDVRRGAARDVPAARQGGKTTWACL